MIKRANEKQLIVGNSAVTLYKLVAKKLSV